MLGIGLDVADAPAPAAYEVHSTVAMCLPYGEPRVTGRANGMLCKQEP
jgi:hypothetical protein